MVRWGRAKKGGEGGAPSAYVGIADASSCIFVLSVPAVAPADFGLAKIYGSPDRRMSPQACTMWYRSPELLFGASAYGAALDMWSLGKGVRVQTRVLEVCTRSLESWQRSRC